MHERSDNGPNRLNITLLWFSFLKEYNQWHFISEIKKENFTVEFDKKCHKNLVLKQTLWSLTISDPPRRLSYEQWKNTSRRLIIPLDKGSLLMIGCLLLKFETALKIIKIKLAVKKNKGMRSNKSGKSKVRTYQDNYCKEQAGSECS